MNSASSLHEILKNKNFYSTEETLIAEEINHIINSQKVSYPWPNNFTELKKSIFYYGINLSRQTQNNQDNFIKELAQQIIELETRITELWIHERSENLNRLDPIELIIHFKTKTLEFRTEKSLCIRHLSECNHFQIKEFDD